MSARFDAAFLEDEKLRGGSRRGEFTAPESATLETQLEALIQERTFLQPFHTSVPFIWALTEREVARLQKLVGDQELPVRTQGEVVIERSVSSKVVRQQSPESLLATLSVAPRREPANIGSAVGNQGATGNAAQSEDPRGGLSGLIQRPSSPPPHPMMIARSKSMSAATLSASLGPKKRVKLPVPSERYPEYNFVGRLLGPRGATLKTLERETGCKIMIRGRGSIRKDKEEEVRGKPGWDHVFSEPLHVVIEADMLDDAAATRALNRAREAVELLLVPVPEDRDSLKRQQLRDLAILNGTFRGAMLGPAPPQHLGPARDTSALVGPLSRTASSNASAFQRNSTDRSLSNLGHDGDYDYMRAVGGGVSRVVSMRTGSPLRYTDAPQQQSTASGSEAGANVGMPSTSSTIWGATTGSAGAAGGISSSSRPIGSPVKPGFSMSKSTTSLGETRQRGQTSPSMGSFGLGVELYRSPLGGSGGGGGGGTACDAAIDDSSELASDAHDADLGTIRLVYSSDQRDFDPSATSSHTASATVTKPAPTSNIKSEGGGAAGASTVTFGPASAILP
eukprot:CAMPEP_0185836152 /NCGR_PEP_ID=MMETSP1353-20130828/9176_1 /TAXON_ID=1077150 /ORGANISM="Erythrolobus australicus, Strain CCMP3124" /LENGTH=564 /DNA_ID=CAMNT_0028534905 /DNA_START=251 /DNA_END=1945 /DNA_ORIENTATION=-